MPRNVPQGIRIVNKSGVDIAVWIQIQLHPAGLEGFLDEMAPLYFGGQKDIRRQEEIARKYGIINMDLVEWEELSCFP